MGAEGRDERFEGGSILPLAKEVLIISVAHCKPVRIDSRHCFVLVPRPRNDVQLISTEQLYL